MQFHLWPRGGAHVPPLTFHPGGGFSAKRLFFPFLSRSLPLWLLSPVRFPLFFTGSAFCSCNIREEGALHALAERARRLCVTILNNGESLPSPSLECPVLTQKNDSPLFVGSLPREGQCGEIPKISFPEASTNKIALERLPGDIVRVLWHAPVRAFSPSAPGEEGVMLRARTTEDAALQTFQTIIHGTPCAYTTNQSHLCVTLSLESQEGFLGLKTFFFFFF